uniref:TLC domain containing 3A n=1 Tax=Naja naja TaxID=35670 RepID=A0A8C6V758_NAJNA
MLAQEFWELKSKCHKRGHHFPYWLRNSGIALNILLSRNRHWIAREYIWVVVSYMTYDIYVMYLCHWHKTQDKGPADQKYSWGRLRSFLQKERLMVTHHLFILLVLTPVAVVREGNLKDLDLLICGPAHVSPLTFSIFSSFGAVLQLKMQDSLLHKINGILILVTFFLCRILLFPYMYWAYGRQMNMPIYEVPFRIPLHCNVANALLIAPQIYWFTLICRKAVRLYSSSPAPDRTR